MRRAARVDRNQAEIIDALRAIGASVEPLHFAGRGMPDLLVGLGGVNYLLEVKDGERPPSERELTPAELEWHGAWRGRVVIVASVNDALAALGLADPADELTRAGVPDEVRSVVIDFWRKLAPTGDRAACPICGMAGLEVRSTIFRSIRFEYVLHCQSVQVVGHPVRVR